jgi:cell division protein FtsQ
MTRTAPARPVRVAPEIYRRRRLAGAVVVVMLLGALALVVRVVLYDSGLFEVQGVRVEGISMLPETDVASAAAVPVGAPLASIDTAGIADRVASLPAVALATVSRSWPHTVEVAVVERVPVATTATPAGVQLVDAGGVVYPGTPPPGLPRLVFGAVGPDDPSTRSALGALAALPPPIRSQVLTVDATVVGSGVSGQVTFGLTGNRQVVWGTDERAGEKAAVLVPLLTQPGHVFDVTSPDLPTIRR